MRGPNLRMIKLFRMIETQAGCEESQKNLFQLDDCTTKWKIEFNYLSKHKVIYALDIWAKTNIVYIQIWAAHSD